MIQLLHFFTKNKRKPHVAIISHHVRPFVRKPVLANDPFVGFSWNSVNKFLTVKQKARLSWKLAQWQWLNSSKILAQWQWHFTRGKYWHSDRDTLLGKNIGTVTETLYSRKILAQWQRHFTREKYWHSDSDTLLGKNIGTVTETLYSRKILAQWQWHFTRENIGTVTETLYSGKILAQWQCHFTREIIGTVIVTLYSGKIQAQWQWHFKREKYWHSASDILHEKNIVPVTVTLYRKKYLHSEQHFIQRSQFSSALTKFIDRFWRSSSQRLSMQDPSRTIRFMEVDAMKGTLYLKSQKKNLAPFSTILVRFVQNSVHEMCTKIY